MTAPKKQIDYAYWTMVTLHSDGSLYFDVGVYQTYEALPSWPPETSYPNGTTPWKILLYSNSYRISGASPSDRFTLTTRFDKQSGMVYWSCEVSQAVFTVSFNITESIYARTIQRAFVVGVYDAPLELRLAAPWLSPYWLVYYFQFGIISKYNIGHGGWNVKLEYPQYYKDGNWFIVGKAKSIGGANAFLDARWVWGGENYEGVNAYYYENDASLRRYKIIFYYSGSTLGDHTLLWELKATLVVPTGNALAFDIAFAVKEELAKIGIDVEIDPRSTSDIADTVWGSYWDKTWEEAPGYGWDMVWYEFNSASETLGENLKSHYLANATPPDGGRNIMPWMDKEADVNLIRVLKAMAEGDAETVQTAINYWQEEFMHNPPWIVIYYPKDLMFARGIAFNHNHPVLSHRYVRQAIAHAIPYPYIFQEILPSYGIEAWPGKAPIHPNTPYTDPSGNEVSLFNLELDPFDYNLDKAKQYLDMWRHSQVGTDPTKGPVGDHDLSGFVELADFRIWVKRLGTKPSEYEQYEYPYPYAYPTHDQTLYPNSYWPGNDVDPDNDNNDFVELPEFFSWRDNIGKEYPWDTPVILTLSTQSTNNIAVVPQHTVNPALTPGTNFTISIYTDYAGTDVTAYQFTLSYNPSVIHGVNVTNGDLIVGGSAKFIAGTFDNEAGTLSLTAGYYFEEEMTSGPGTLANVTFTVVGEGASSITIGDETALYGLCFDWDLMDYVEYVIIDAETMPDHIQDGHFRNVGVPAGNTP